MTDLDPRLNAYRTDLADRRLRDRIEAARFVDGVPMRVSEAVVPLNRRPGMDAPIDSQVLFGETVTSFDRRGGWVWCQSVVDDYVGYVPETALAEPGPEPTHWVSVLTTPLYPEPELRRPPVAILSIGSRVTVVGTATVRDLDYALLPDGGAIVASHLAPVDRPIASDFVSIADRFVGLPYIWAGRSGFGVDCSGIIQLAMMMTGSNPLRDSDMQEATIGEARPIDQGLEDLERGDLVFWKGHVGIMIDPVTLLHASGYHMLVARDEARVVIDRLEAKGLPVAAVRRPEPIARPH
ncbi:MAG: NlpC/P60 family protein [Pseudomonadota bacterium]